MKKTAVKPHIFIPTLYIIEGLPYSLVKEMSAVFLKNLNVENSFNTLVTNLLTIPWTIKLLWGPLVDLHGTRRSWIIVCQLVLAAFAAILAAVTLIPNAVWPALCLFALVAFASATQDIAIDGYYMDVLDKKSQALYVGVRSAFYKIALLLGQGGLVYLAGKLAINSSFGLAGAWSVSFVACAIIFACAALFHNFALPEVQTSKRDGVEKQGSEAKEFARVFSTFFSQKGILAIVVYILTFRLGDAFMLAIAKLFWLDPVEKGGLALSTADVGLIYGTVGVICSLGGGLLGSWLVTRFGLRRCLLPSAILQSLAIPLYWLLAVSKPNLGMIAAITSFEYFSYGLATACYTVYLLNTVSPEFKASHYAIATGMMAIGLLLPGMSSGYLQEQMGYPAFFLFSFLASIPGIITIFFLPWKDPEQEPEVA